MERLSLSRFVVVVERLSLSRFVVVVERLSPSCFVVVVERPSLSRSDVDCRGVMVIGSFSPFHDSIDKFYILCDSVS